LLTGLHFRNASPDDAEAVRDLLQAAYPPLLASSYEPELLARALPLMTTPNPVLLASGTWYVAEESGAPGMLLSCGGWTRERPGAPDEPVDPALAHLRHLATHPRWTRRGIGRALFDRCAADASRVGVRAFECYATLNAEPFYRSLGFKTIEPITVPMAPGLAFPSIRMACRIDSRIGAEATNGAAPASRGAGTT